MFEGIITQTIVGTATGKNYSNRWGCETCTEFVVSVAPCSKHNRAYDFSDIGCEERLILQLCSHKLYHVVSTFNRFDIFFLKPFRFNFHLACR